MLYNIFRHALYNTINIFIYSCIIPYRYTHTHTRCSPRLSMPVMDDGTQRLRVLDKQAQFLELYKSTRRKDRSTTRGLLPQSSLPSAQFFRTARLYTPGLCVGLSTFDNKPK